MKNSIDEGQYGMFGYGSLLLKSSMEATLGYPYAKPLYYCSVKGWRRKWSSFMPNLNFYSVTRNQRFYPKNILYLNVESNEASSVNGLVYLLTEQELRFFDRREWIYDRVDVTQQIPKLELEIGKIFLYSGKESYVLRGPTNRDQHAIRASYIKIVEEGLQSLGPAACHDYNASTDPVPNDLVFDDQKDPGSHPTLADPSNPK